MVRGCAPRARMTISSTERPSTRGINHMSTKTLETSPARVVAAAVFALSTAFVPSASRAQDVRSSNGFELRPYVGAYIPTGDQRDILNAAVPLGGHAWNGAL